MRILLINPEFPETFWSLKSAIKFISRKSLLPPLGLLTVAAILPEAWDKRLIDMNTSGLRDKDLLWADYVFITAMLIQRKSVDEILQRCQTLGVKTLAGGPLFTSLPEEYVHVDHLVLKEAEITLSEFVTDVQNGTTRKIYTTHEKADLRQTPVPLWSLVNIKKYAVMPTQYSRGCPFNCDFCDVTTLFGHEIRTKDTSQVIKELQSIYDSGWRGNVFFVDDNFIGNKTRLKTEVLPAIETWMRERNRPFSFNTQASINLSDDPELMQAMVRAGFDCVFVGIETPNEKSLNECNKVQNKGRDMVQCVAKIQQAGMQVQAGFILGFDSDEPGIFNDLIRFIQESGVVVAMVGLLNAPRGTTLYKRMAVEQRLTRPATGDNTDCSMNFLPKMGMHTLMEGYQKVIKTIYSQSNYCDRILTFLKNYKVPADRIPHYQFREIRAFIKTIWQFGILRRGRRYYWKLIFWSLPKRQRLYLAVSLIIYGHHFRSMIRSFEELPVQM
ncbi:MAG: B12-binding domain-containing radical SAM protein [Sedimentisphaerales bacterium]|nr:B12-binding domain-containing radical SAM protein [Sedimentisphaerales bacterium]